MSWTEVENPYQAFKEEALNTGIVVDLPQWKLDIWEKTSSYPQGRRLIEETASCLREKADLRIIFAPLDLIRKDSLDQVFELYRILGVPRDFTTERIQSVSHSFRRKTDRNGSCTWFHFLCKNIDVKIVENTPEVANRAVDLGYHASTLPQADYSYHRSGFFLRVDNDGTVTLACFGATPRVKGRLLEFIASRAWKDVAAEPYILFDLVLEGLYFEVDRTVWNMNAVFGPLEHLILEYANAKGIRKITSKIPFAAMHNCAKHIVHVAEALESCNMLVDATLENIGDHAHAHVSQVPGREAVMKELRECLRYRLSLFRSSQLRLSSLQKRIDNAITLSFNIVTQQDSMVMIQDSNSMKIIAAITMIFLPTTGVATVIGSQLFLSEVSDDKQDWDIMTTPLFWVMWWIAIPLTVFVAILAVSWHWWTHHEHPRGEVVHIVKRAATFNSAGRKKA